MNKRQLFLFNKANGAIRQFMSHYMAGLFPLYIVTEYPKSGGTWFGQMLADYMKIPFPRNRFPMMCSQVMHGHYRYHPNMQNVFCVVRDGRDVMVSFYYHNLFAHENGLNAHSVQVTRRSLQITDPENVQKNLSKFIEYQFVKKVHPAFTWKGFIEDWINKDVPIIKYEDLLICAPDVLFEAIQQVTGKKPERSQLIEIAEHYKFEKITGRKSGQERRNSFLRKGIAGDWKNKFNKKSRVAFDYYAGDTLIKLGYEKNRDWVMQDDRKLDK